MDLRPPSNLSEFDDLLFALIDGNKVGDIWVQSDGCVYYRKNSDVHTLNGFNSKTIKESLVQEWFKKILGTYDIQFAVDTSYTIQRGALSRRFRVNAYKSLGKIRICFRLVADNICSPEELRVPKILTQEFCNYTDGLVLICGATGSGKSTTIASLLDSRSKLKNEHIVTLEDPIEYLFRDNLAFFSQREKNSDFKDYPDAIKHALRESPDTIFIGEIRDKETAEAALEAAETGHLVVSTMHTKRASDALERFLLMFPKSDEQRILSMMSSVMRFVLCQRLLPSTFEGRVAVFEPMLINDASNLQPVIRRGEQLAVSLRSTMEITNYAHNYTFSKDALNLLNMGLISKLIYDQFIKEFEQ